MRRQAASRNWLWILASAQLAWTTVAAQAQDADAGTGSATTNTAEPSLAPAQRPALSLTWSPRHGLRTGQLLNLQIEALAGEGDDVTVPEQSFGIMSIQRKRVRVDAAKDGKQRFVFTLELLPLEPGDAQIGPLTLRVVTKSGEVGTVQTQSFSVRVGSWIANEPNAQPKPPSKPVTVTQPDYTLAWVGGGLLLLVLTVLLTLWAARRWRRRVRQQTPAPPPRPPWEVALERLAELRGDRLSAVEQQRLVEWIDGLSDALRNYLGRRFGFEGLESTSDEIVAHLRSLRPAGLTPEEVALILRECDLVKFAKVPADAERCDLLLHQAVHLVETTRPLPAIETKGAAAPTTPATRERAP